MLNVLIWIDVVVFSNASQQCVANSWQRKDDEPELVDSCQHSGITLLQGSAL